MTVYSITALHADLYFHENSSCRLVYHWFFILSMFLFKARRLLEKGSLHDLVTLYKISHVGLHGTDATHLFVTSNFIRS